MKTISGKVYVYLSVRDGRRVRTKYIGPAGSVKAQKAMAERRAANAVPERFRSLFWDTSLQGINLRLNAGYVIERVLEYGSLDALLWLQRVYPVRRILDAAETSRALSEKSRQFWRVWFGLEAA